MLVLCGKTVPASCTVLGVPADGARIQDLASPQVILDDGQQTLQGFAIQLQLCA